MPDWLKAALDDATALEPGVAGLIHIFGAAHNEMTAGGGTTSPTSVTQALFDAAEEILAAVNATASPAKAGAILPGSTDGAKVTPAAKASA
jgi:hypothetical protein